MTEENNIYEASVEMKDASKTISAFTVFKFIKMMSDPFTKMEAYKLGIIDENGKFLKKVYDLTSTKEKKSVDAFNRLIINLKKIIKKVPDPKLKAQMKTISTAMVLLKDEAEKYGADGEYVVEEIKGYLFDCGIDVDKEEINQSFTELLEGENNAK